MKIQAEPRRLTDTTFSVTATSRTGRYPRFGPGSSHRGALDRASQGLWTDAFGAGLCDNAKNAVSATRRF
jgi:hypothetical protein